MSAFDIAGAVVATPMALGLIHYMWGGERPDSGLAFWLAIPFALWAVFCVARLFGATL